MLWAHCNVSRWLQFTCTRSLTYLFTYDYLSYLSFHSPKIIVLKYQLFSSKYLLVICFIMVFNSRRSFTAYTCISGPYKEGLCDNWVTILNILNKLWVLIKIIFNASNENPLFKSFCGETSTFIPCKPSSIPLIVQADAECYFVM